MVKGSFRQGLIRLVTFLGGLYFFLRFVLPEKMVIAGEEYQFSRYNDQISTGVVAVGYLALGLGIINLLLSHGSTIAFLKRGWVNSLALLLGLFSMLAVSGLDWRNGQQISDRARTFFVLRDFAAKIASDNAAGVADLPPLDVRVAALKEAISQELTAVRAIVELPAPRGSSDLLKEKLAATEKLLTISLDKVEQAALQVSGVGGLEPLSVALAEGGAAAGEYLNARFEGSRTKKLYRLLYDGLFVALGSAMFSLLGFYIATAAFRAFRVRSAESALMMVAALAVILGQIPLAVAGEGAWSTLLSAYLPEARRWLLSVPNGAAFRAIELGSAIAGLILALRMWFSIESDSFAERER